VTPITAAVAAAAVSCRMVNELYVYSLFEYPSEKKVQQFLSLEYSMHWLHTMYPVKMIEELHMPVYIVRKQ